MRNGGLFWIISAIVVGAVGYLIFNSFNRPVPGELVEDRGRKHILDIAESSYSSHPPTSGDHFPIWAKKGVYDRVISEGYLIHSLEHGYVVVHYDCTKKFSSFHLPFSIFVRAHEGVDDETISTESAKPLTRMNIPVTAGMSFFTPENPPAVEVELPKEFESEECKQLVENLREVSKVAERVVVVPHPGLDNPIILTAWNRMVKLDRIDKNKMIEFIKAWHNRGPEKTVE